MKLLVTGGAGYIGSICPKLLLAAGHEVVVSTASSAATAKPSIPPRGSSSPTCSTRKPSTRRSPRVSTASCISRRWLWWANRLNIPRAITDERRGSLNLLEAIRRRRVRGWCSPRPAPSTASPTRSRSARTRRPAPRAVWSVEARRRRHDLRLLHGPRLGAVSLRYFNVAGASGATGEVHEPETHLIPNVLATCSVRASRADIFGDRLPDARRHRDPRLHPRRGSRQAHLLALDAARTGVHQVLNLGNGTGFSVREVITAAEQVTGRRFRRSSSRAGRATHRCSSPPASASDRFSAGRPASRNWPT